jgi:cytochrome c-type biogenesis protein CcmH
MSLSYLTLRGTFLALALVALGYLGAAAQDLDAEARGIAHQLQCPVCENLSVADSPSQLATQMRELIRAKLAAGESREAIMAYFTDRYGESVLLAPPKTGFNLVAWIGPYVGVAAAIAFLIWVVRRRPQRAPTAPDPEDEAAEPYLAEVDRTLADLGDRPIR